MAKSINHEDEENSRRGQTQPTDVDKDDDVGDLVNSGVAADDNDEDDHQQLSVIAVVDASLGGKLMLLSNSSKPS
uniref:Uncharacterized protein n=1 Tax=Oryza sativa subsp. japonica TaxID=39947 RepID=Q5VMK4_ORYSJ|nr:hypothetical protein [Oryza sativa Japonica Group]BAD69321.1 hypothetical protein [Oryza sativa Japonica Group]